MPGLDKAPSIDLQTLAAQVSQLKEDGLGDESLKIKTKDGKLEVTASKKHANAFGRKIRRLLSSALPGVRSQRKNDKQTALNTLANTLNDSTILGFSGKISVADAHSILQKALEQTNERHHSNTTPSPQNIDFSAEETTEDIYSEIGDVPAKADAHSLRQKTPTEDFPPPPDSWLTDESGTQKKSAEEIDSLYAKVDFSKKRPKSSGSETVNLSPSAQAVKPKVAPKPSKRTQRSATTDDNFKFPPPPPEAQAGKPAVAPKPKPQIPPKPSSLKKPD